MTDSNQAESEAGVLFALTVRQPWAHAILHLGKTVENRTWSTNHRGLLVIHAGKRMDLTVRHLPGHPDTTLTAARREAPLGAIVGIVDLVDVVRGHPSVWAEPGQYHWLLENPRPCPPIPYTGRLGLFNIPARLLHPGGR